MRALNRTTFDLWGVAPHLHVPFAADSEVETIAREARARGLDIVCFTPEQVAYPVNIASPDARLRTTSISMFKRAAELSVKLSTGLQPPLLLLTSGRGFESEPRASAWVRSADAVGEIAEYAGGLGVHCAIEPLQRVESNLVNSVSDAARMIGEVDNANLGAVLDTVAMTVAGDDADTYFRMLGSKIHHIHLIDGDPDGHLAWGEGRLPLDDILSAINRNGYEGLLTVELFGDGNYAIDPRPAVEKSLSEIDRAEKRILQVTRS